MWLKKTSRSIKVRVESTKILIKVVIRGFKAKLRIC